MKKFLSISLVSLLIISGITVAFATESGKAIVATTTGATSATAGATNITQVATVAGTTSVSGTTAGSTATTTAVSGTTAGSTATTAGGTGVTSAATTSNNLDMSFTGTPVKLSLDEAYKIILKDSSGAKMAALNRQGAEAVAEGYTESLSSINKAAKDPESWVDTSSKPLLDANRVFAAAQAPRNYDAEINALKRDTIENYYSLKELEHQCKFASDNLALKQTLLSNTQLKFKLGTVSKNDILKAEATVLEAKNSLIAAENGLNTIKMGFNQFMGYNSLMQNVTLTDEIKEIPLASKSLSASINDALKNRNEIYGATYNLKMASLQLDLYKAYPHYSSKYMTAEKNKLLAETGFKNAPLSVERDVRTKYMAMNEKYSAVQSGKKSIENSKETLRLVQLQYDAGLATVSDVEGAQLGYYNTQLSFSKALLEYNLAIYDYEMSSTVGTETASIQ